MPLIWCSISGHGFGHAAQVVPVLNELRRLVAGLHVILRTTVPRGFFKDRLEGEWELSVAEQDVGCVQQGPLHIDIGATWAKHRRFHTGWDEKVADEARAIQAKAPDLLLSNISYLAIEAGVQTKVPTVALSTLSWDRILEPWMEPAGPSAEEQDRVIQHITRCYGMADLMIRPAPGLPLSAFRKVVDVGPIAPPPAKATQRVREMIGAEAEERLVLVGFGGIPLDSVPAERLETIAGYRFIVGGPVPAGCRRLRSADSVPFPFRTLLASADILVTKPGYSTVVEAVAQSVPVAYVRRYNFADEQGLVEYLHGYGRAAELSADDFVAGRWEHALDAAWRAPQPPADAPPPTGAAEAAAILAGYL